MVVSPTLSATSPAAHDGAEAPLQLQQETPPAEKEEEAGRDAGAEEATFVPAKLPRFSSRPG